MIPCGLWGALGSMVLYVGTSINVLITSHIATYHASIILATYRAVGLVLTRV